MHLRTILLSDIHHLGDGRFGFPNPNGLVFDYRDDALDFYAAASKMKCYRSEANEILCDVDSFKFFVPFPHGAQELKYVFIDKIYSEPHCHNAIVVDVGAFIGDSSIFFASRGAKQVVAFEPVPILYEILKKNVVLNVLEKVIQTKNEAIGDISGIAEIGYDPTHPGISGESLGQSNITFSIPSVPLSEVITDLGWVDILKMNCEGCEHKALRHAEKTGALKHVGMIVVQVHSEVRNVIELLKRDGFKMNGLEQLIACKEFWVLSAQRSS